MATVKIPAPRVAQKPGFHLPLDFFGGAGGIRPSVAGLADGAGADAPADGGEAQQQETVGVSTASENADGIMVLLSYILVGLGLWIGNMLAAKATVVKFTPLDGIGMLALFFVMAQALERLMEPLSEVNIPKIKFGSTKNTAAAKRDRQIQQAMAETDLSARQNQANAAADTDAESKKIGANTKVVIWGLATFVAMLISGATHVFFLDAVGASGVPIWVNVLVTGLVVGSGTKPLHELVKMLEKKNETDSSDEGGESGAVDA
jgi:hypothetical protein